MELSEMAIGQNAVNEEGQRFNRKDAAKYLGVALVTIDRLIKARKVGFFRIGRRLVFSKKHLDDFLSKNEVHARITGNRFRTGEAV